ncbi:tetraacyldisaccharide 4'-kinase [Propionivibrio limicola]|uniref:tetraacyldisaccharide 4'-kinase n=1 Tax=Propionivibrio limicola TaxID=167645 RepID=UPI001FEB0F04|nr:tetraacyldisaccharide 4'-kinase [Propionivibrio limicola]
MALQLIPLLPLSWLYRLVVSIRRALFAAGVLASESLSVPVVVVGNLTVGGAGKTPFVLWLVEQLRECGWKPGIISRGYGGAVEGVCEVTVESDSRVVGDEPLLLAKKSGVPVFVGRDRVAAGQALVSAHPECNVVISDDGLQHYRLRRDVEIVLFDGRGAGNSQLLPAGPLREPLRRARGVTAIVWNGGLSAGRSLFGEVVPQFAMHLTGDRFRSLRDASCFCAPDAFQGRPVYAVAGIGDPSRFFAQLESLKICFEAHPFPDHHAYVAEDFAWAQQGVILMTEKDAVKCPSFAVGEAWVLPVEARIDAGRDGKTLLQTILEKLNGRSLA